jgi:hypothetical protein
MFVYKSRSNESTDFLAFIPALEILLRMIYLRSEAGGKEQQYAAHTVRDQLTQTYKESQHSTTNISVPSEIKFIIQKGSGRNRIWGYVQAIFEINIKYLCH